MSPQAYELTQVAQTYCRLIEGSNGENNGWLEQLANLLPRLHAAVASLDGGIKNHNHALVADLDARFELYTHLRDLLGRRDSYWMEFDVAGDGQTKSGSLADDLTDIYCELKHGLKLLEGTPDIALEGWRNGFRMHWGQHLVDAERHLYELSVRGELP